MLVVLSPAKSLDYDSPLPFDIHTQPLFVEQSAALVTVLRSMSVASLAQLMSISDALAELNVARYAQWSSVFSQQNARQAIFAFNGDVYDGLNAKTLNEEGLHFAQAHVRILSGLYGVLRPLDLMQPYRLEMGTSLPNSEGANLYAYWKKIIVHALNEAFGGNHEVLVNLASDEYFKSVDRRALKAVVIQPKFQDFKNGQYKTIGFFAKKARGLMARYLIDHRIHDVEQLKQFNVNGYLFEASVSSATEWVFRRKEGI
jgi:uncharacterized protein